MSAMIKAEAPITGGISCPPVPAVARRAALNTGLNPPLFIIGYVMTPTEATLAAALPLIIPKRPEARMDALPGPPIELRVAYFAIETNNFPAGVAARKAPKIIK